MPDLDDLQVDIEYSNKDGESVDKALRRLEFQRKERLSIVPTLDADVRTALELLSQPVELPEEDNFRRRERLSELIQKDDKSKELVSKYVLASGSYTNGPVAVTEEDNEEFYTPASETLVQLRKYLIGYTIRRSRSRLQNERRELADRSVRDVLSKRRKLQADLSNISLAEIQIIDEKPISEVRKSPDGSVLACCGWSGTLSLVDQSLEKVYVNKSLSNTRISGIDWTLDSRNILACTHQGQLALYSCDDINTVEILHENTARYAQVRVHPSGNLATCTSFDKTWKLFDLQTKTCLLSQEGHSCEVFSLGLQNDGSLICTGGLDSIGLVWDLRSGKAIMSLQGHSKPIYSIDWSPNGYQIASGSGDGTIKVWDIRRKGEGVTILAHNGLISQVKFDTIGGNFLVSSSYDRTVNVFNADNWQKIKTLEGHLDKVMTVELSESSIFSSGWDRSLNKWSY